ncbi:MAG: PH domain-containing protein, partial [Acidimicrobiia bacterium]|nr:PH domain-containing protein [Acidimicrobiia bacterium]
MNLNRFQHERQDRWARLDRLVTTAGSRPEQIGPAAVRELATLYRAAAADLAYARQRYPGEAVVGRLENLVGRARLVVYERHSRRTSIVEFFGRGYWQLLWQRRWFVLLAGVLLFGPSVFGFLFGYSDPDAAATYLPEGFLWVRDAESTDQGLGTVGLAAFSLFVMTNNIFVTLLTFVLGIVWGVGTA